MRVSGRLEATSGVSSGTPTTTPDTRRLRLRPTPNSSAHHRPPQVWLRGRPHGGATGVASGGLPVSVSRTSPTTRGGPGPGPSCGTGPSGPRPPTRSPSPTTTPSSTP